MRLEDLTLIEPAPTPGDTKWFRHDRFGMFIHWGLYALGARHEWLKEPRPHSDRGVRQVFPPL